MRAVDLIRKKRDGGTLSSEEISFLVEGNLKGTVPDYQLSAFLMAVYNKGMDEEETVALTMAMAAAGKKLELGGIQGVKIDKHSTGGVGDKTNLILAPLMAAMGLKMPSIAGRGLGHTGGTIDKLASIPGLRTDIAADEVLENMKNVGFSICRQTDEIGPADKKIYARGMTEIAREAGLGRESLYKALSPEGNPEFATVLKVLRALGLTLHVKAAHR